ncbi:uncharacterized protein RCC_10418 [Ramularia collo-cygni]|uniref:RING finger domain protein (Znf1) n=1 Tax=Ramularia collo-cygni TaxID=112498 RepID=A0A2D3VJT4_9PEZI|nr:uncharacterized protein RCC_10418 [Ramularia collo-cygni]CZT24691.1 uncharacterized protein RCC_10418 [Ramularia collo-cygni]
MENDGLRRSGRTRTTVKTFQSEQEQAAQVLPIRKKATGSHSKDKPENTTGVSVKDEPSPDVQETDSDVTSGNFQPTNGEAASEYKPSKKRARFTEPGDVKDEDDADLDVLQEKPKKKRAKKSASVPGQQLYGAPPVGTLIPWGTRWRKQPQIFAVTRGSGTSSKTNDWMQGQAETRVREVLQSIEKLAPGEVETRLAKSIAEPSEEYQGYLDRANTHKMFILSRLRGVEHDCHANHTDCPYETLQVAGSKGSIYSVRISHLTTCTCPSATGLFMKKIGERPQCKHVIYVLHHVLKAPEHLKYQKAFLSSELKELFAAAPPLPAQVAKAEPKDGKRKAVEGDCPVCFTEFGEESVTWCRTSCGNNIHTECLQEWAKAKTARLSCPFCRADWEFADKDQAIITEVEMPTTTDKGGYLNVYDQLSYK